MTSLRLFFNKMEWIEITENGAPAREIGGLPEVATDVMKSTAEMYKKTGYQPPWVGYLAFDGTDCVGTCAFKTPPVNGRVEIAYFTFPGNEGRGVATSMARKLIEVAILECPTIWVVEEHSIMDDLRGDPQSYRRDQPGWTTFAFLIGFQSQVELFMKSSREILQRVQDLPVGRPLPVIHINGFPPHDPFFVDHVGCGMRQALASFVQDAVAIYDSVSRIRKKNNARRFAIFLRNSFVHFLQIGPGINRDCNNLRIRESRIF